VGLGLCFCPSRLLPRCKLRRHCLQPCQLRRACCSCAVRSSGSTPAKFRPLLGSARQQLGTGQAVWAGCNRIKAVFVPFPDTRALLKRLRPVAQRAQLLLHRAQLLPQVRLHSSSDALDAL
jgi:hypothetical protein